MHHLVEIKNGVEEVFLRLKETILNADVSLGKLRLACEDLLEVLMLDFGFHFGLCEKGSLQVWLGFLSGFYEDVKLRRCNSDNEIGLDFQGEEVFDGASNRNQSFSSNSKGVEFDSLMRILKASDKKKTQIDPLTEYYDLITALPLDSTIINIKMIKSNLNLIFIKYTKDSNKPKILKLPNSKVLKELWSEIRISNGIIKESNSRFHNIKDKFVRLETLREYRGIEERIMGFIRGVDMEYGTLLRAFVNIIQVERNEAYKRFTGKVENVIRKYLESRFGSVEIEFEDWAWEIILCCEVNEALVRNWLTFVLDSLFGVTKMEVKDLAMGLVSILFTFCIFVYLNLLCF